MEINDRVKMDLGPNYGPSIGTVKKITKDGFVVVIWDNVNGEWYWTEDQAKQLEIINENR